MTKDEVWEALRGKLHCIYAYSDNTSERIGFVCCGNEAATPRPGDGPYMARGKGKVCHLMDDVRRGTACSDSSCRFACGEWYRKLLECWDDGEARKVLGRACTGWTPPAATNRIPGEAEP